MHPRDAKSPAWRIAPGSIEIVHINADWSLATMTYDGVEDSVGIRWNGDIENPTDLGYPNARSNGAWFILPDGIAEIVLSVVQNTGKLPPALALD